LTLLISTDKSKLSRYDKLAHKRFLIPDGIVQLSIFYIYHSHQGREREEEEDSVHTLSVYRRCIGASISITILASLVLYKY
jgi:hypothetical protein